MTTYEFDTFNGEFDVAAVAAAKKFSEVAQNVSDGSNFANLAFAIANLFLWHIEAFEQGTENPVPAFVDAFSRATDFLQRASESGPCQNFFPIAHIKINRSLAQQDIFGDIYRVLTDEDLRLAEATLRTRLEANGVSPEELFGGKVVADAGCGIGKYALAMSNFGATKVTGVDVSREAIDKAKREVEPRASASKLEFDVGSVLDLPLMSECADVVWCNSVLHLVDRPQDGLNELSRVLKLNGIAFVYVNGRFGLVEILVRTLHIASRQLPRALLHDWLLRIGVAPGRAAWLVGFVYANYHFFDRKEFEDMIERSGFEISTMLWRGLPSDQSDIVAKDAPYAKVKYGESKLNYLLKKRR